MGAVKRNGNSTVPMKKPEAEIYPVATAEKLLADMQKLAEAYSKLIAAHDVNKPVPQAALLVSRAFEQMEKVAKAATEVFESRAKAIHETNGHFEVGRMAISFPDNGKRNPKWKDEACTKAEECHALRSNYVDRTLPPWGDGLKTAYIDTVMAKYVVEPRIGVKLTLSEA